MGKFFKYTIFKISLIFAVIFLDQITKYYLYGKNVVLINNLIGLRPSTLNTGGAWSVFSNNMWLLIVLSILFVIIASLFDYFFKNYSKVYSCAFGFLLGGTIGNLIDRLFLGGVRDFIYFDFWISYPTFNMADVFILLGMILLFVFVIFIYKPTEKNKK